MVLDLKAPADDRLSSLLKLWPSFLCYAISFVYVAIYWINHHALLAPAKRVTPALMWSNNALLFFCRCFRSPPPIWRQRALARLRR
jgi:uncharacterized membrane protein